MPQLIQRLLPTEGNTIMSDSNTIVRERQLAIRRELDRRGIALKAVSFDSGIPYPTLLSYFPVEGSREPAMMPVSALYCLFGALDTDLLNLLAPEGFAIVQVPAGIDHDEVAEAMVDYLAEKQRCHHPESECGPAIGPREETRLSGKVIAFRAANA